MMLFAVSIASTLLLALGVRYTMWQYAPHSGAGTPPMYGDFEAQRHWVEITNALPMAEWYVDTPKNNLTYWGLDYPPLTAYHSQLVGQVARQFLQRKYGVAEGNRRWDSSFGLRTSRGSETPQTVGLMRNAALLSEVLVFVPACCLLVAQLYALAKGLAGDNQRLQRNLGTAAPFALAVLLVWGALSMIYIDHGHFQFNAVSLGLFVWSCYMLLLDCLQVARLGPSGTFVYLGLSIALYVASYCFKQMSLYYCIGFAAIFFARCMLVTRERKSAVWLLTALVFCLCVGVGSMLLAFYPFILNGTYGNVLQRVFPVQRGLYEDKVANAWCCLSLVWKLPPTVLRLMGSDTTEEMVNRVIFFVCAFATVVACNPAIIGTVTSAFEAKVSRKAKEEEGHGHAHHAHQHGPGCSHGPPAAPEALTAAEQRQALASFTSQLWVLLASSLGFYLFSFQVHEKSILLPAMPAAVLLAVFALLPGLDAK